MVYMDAARTNLTSHDVRIENRVIGDGTFRVCLAGTFVGGNRNNQEAACKRFKPEFREMEDEFFSKDFQIADKVIEIATEWNEICPRNKEILVNRGNIHQSNSRIKYLVEPLIRYYEKFTSNTGWIGDKGDWEVRCMEAFSHFSYEYSDGGILICDIQGRYRDNRRYRGGKSRFELSDPAICSRTRRYGPTDLGEKGIDLFFANHECNEFCQRHWSRPYGRPRQWFPQSSGTTMLPSRMNNVLMLTSRATFRHTMGMILEDYDDDDSSNDSW
eukprot:Nitzschia sp. Nitz4//scaffold183_size43938//3017//3832//NITZ4_007263-RA/size43938-processed-gene-0.48-mRNA-1//1//CDS//3329539593//5177//frame0